MILLFQMFVLLMQMRVLVNKRFHTGITITRQDCVKTMNLKVVLLVEINLCLAIPARHNVWCPNLEVRSLLAFVIKYGNPYCWKYFFLAFSNLAVSYILILCIELKCFQFFKSWSITFFNLYRMQLFKNPIWITMSMLSFCALIELFVFMELEWSQFNLLVHTEKPTNNLRMNTLFMTKKPLKPRRLFYIHKVHLLCLLLQSSVWRYWI